MDPNGEASLLMRGVRFQKKQNKNYMKTTLIPSPVQRPRCRGFSLVEFLVVLAILLIVASLLLPMLNRSEATSQRAACLANKRQVSVAGLMFAADHLESLPPAGISTLTGQWLTDIPQATVDGFLIYGAERNALYEPTVSQREQDRLWKGIERSSLRIIGMALATKGAPRLLPENEIVKTTSRLVVRDGSGTRTAAPMEMFWAADVTLSDGDRQAGRSANNYFRVMRAGHLHESDHLGVDGIPEGGNAIAVDGHVEWRRFDRMNLRTSGNGPELAAFWW
jgi:prepilin-type N-terminal cleavage/methylation domain-containing protein